MAQRKASETDAGEDTRRALKSGRNRRSGQDAHQHAIHLLFWKLLWWQVPVESIYNISLRGLLESGGTRGTNGTKSNIIPHDVDTGDCYPLGRRGGKGSRHSTPRTTAVIWPQTTKASGAPLHCGCVLWDGLSEWYLYFCSHASLCLSLFCCSLLISLLLVLSNEYFALAAVVFQGATTILGGGGANLSWATRPQCRKPVPTACA